MKFFCALLTLLCTSLAWAGIPATPVMTLYRFNGPLEIPYYRVDAVASGGSLSPAGTLVQGASVIPCVLVENGQPLTDKQGIPYVGFEVVVDPRKDSPASTARYKQAGAN